MGVLLKTDQEIERLAQGGALLGAVLEELVERAKPGVSTKDLDRYAQQRLEEHGTPAFLGFHGFEASICTSVNDVVIHGVPDDTPLARGDVLGIDIGLIYEGLVTDTAVTIVVGSDVADLSAQSDLIQPDLTEPDLMQPDLTQSDFTQRDGTQSSFAQPDSMRLDAAHSDAVQSQRVQLLKVTQHALYAGIQAAQPGNRTGDIGAAVMRTIEPYGYGNITAFAGHGVGFSLHEAPSIPNVAKAGSGAKIRPGMVIAIEPMITLGTSDVAIDPDGWSARTRDGQLGAQFEHTVAITSDGPRVLTKRPSEVLPEGLAAYE